MIGPFEFSNPQSVMMSASARVVAITVWDSKGDKHEFVAVASDPGEIWFGTRQDFEARATA